MLDNPTFAKEMYMDQRTEEYIIDRFIEFMPKTIVYKSRTVLALECNTIIEQKNPCKVDNCDLCKDLHLLII